MADMYLSNFFGADISRLKLPRWLATMCVNKAVVWIMEMSLSSVVPQQNPSGVHKFHITVLGWGRKLKWFVSFPTGTPSCILLFHCQIEELTSALLSHCMSVAPIIRCCELKTRPLNLGELRTFGLRLGVRCQDAKNGRSRTHNARQIDAEV